MACACRNASKMLADALSRSLSAAIEIARHRDAFIRNVDAVSRTFAGWARVDLSPVTVALSSRRDEA
jgi:hypothetical protein